MNGAWGEALAARYLQKKRYKIVATNYRSRFGEIDLIAADRKFLVFVEVKLRKSDQFVSARECGQAQAGENSHDSLTIPFRISYKSAATV